MIIFLIWCGLKLSIKFCGAHDLFDDKQYILNVEFVCLLHPLRWCLGFWSCITELVGFPPYSPSLYGVKHFVKVVCVLPRYMVSCWMFGFMFDNSSMPKVKTFMNLIFGWLEAHNNTGPSHMQAYQEREPTDSRELCQVVEQVLVLVWAPWERHRQQYKALLNADKFVSLEDMLNMVYERNTCKMWVTDPLGLGSFCGRRNLGVDWFLMMSKTTIWRTFMSTYWAAVGENSWYLR